MKKIIRMILLCLLLAAVSATAMAGAIGADGKVICADPDVIKGYTSDGYHYLYFGSRNGSPIKWRVLDTKTNMGTDGLFLLAEDVFELTPFGGDKDAGNYVSEWPDSDARKWCQTFYANHFSKAEQKLILSTNKSDPVMASDVSGLNYMEYPNILQQDKLFFLSAAEATNPAYGFAAAEARVAKYQNANQSWWLRSRFDQVGHLSICVNSAGTLSYAYTYNSSGARPALNFDTSSVLFVFAAEGEREWKLTLLDDTRSFAVSETSLKGVAGETVKVNYSGAVVGTNEYVSAMLMDGNDVLFYGRVAQGSTSGTAEIPLPANLADGDYTLRLFSEQYNGAKQTGYASSFKDIVITLAPASPSAPSVPSDVPQTGDSSQIALWSGMLMLSLAGMVMVLRKRGLKTE